MRRFTALLWLGLLGTPSLAAQSVVQPAAPLDSSRAVLRDAVLRLRDSLITIDGAAGRLQRDYREASGASLLSRARLMHDACARSIKALPPTRATIVAADLSGSLRIKSRRQLVGALDSLKLALRYCETEFSALSQPGQAEAVRGYANDRAGRIQGALRNYERTLQVFLQAMGIKILPAGIYQSPSAG